MNVRMNVRPISRRLPDVWMKVRMYVRMNVRLMSGRFAANPYRRIVRSSVCGVFSYFSEGCGRSLSKYFKSSSAYRPFSYVFVFFAMDFFVSFCE